MHTHTSFGIQYLPSINEFRDTKQCSLSDSESSTLGHPIFSEKNVTRLLCINLVKTCSNFCTFIQRVHFNTCD